MDFEVQWECHTPIAARCVGAQILDVSAAACHPSSCNGWSDCVGVLRRQNGCFVLTCTTRARKRKFGVCHALRTINSSTLTATLMGGAGLRAAHVAAPASSVRRSHRAWTWTQLYYEHVPLTFRPSPDEYAALLVPQRNRDTRAPARVVALVIGACSRQQNLLDLRATWCSRPEQLECWVYLDCNRLVVRHADELAPLRLVPLNDYLKPHVSPLHMPRDRCCNRTRLRKQLAADGAPSRFFCSAARRKTLRFQYRFLPALAHARGRLMYDPDLADGAIKWLTLVHDDSFGAFALPACPLRECPLVPLTHTRQELTHASASFAQSTYRGCYTSSRGSTTAVHCTSATSLNTRWHPTRLAGSSRLHVTMRG